MGLTSRREDRFNRGGYGVDRRRNEGRNTFNRDGLVPYRVPDLYQARRDQGSQHLKSSLSSLTKLPKEILATEPQLNLQPPKPMQLPPKKENQDRYCDYHGEKGHYTNDCFQLRRQLKMALESGKLNHLIKDVRQRVQGNAKGRDVGKDKIINMIRLWPDDKKRKSIERDESWMKAPISFPPLSVEDVLDEPLVIEAVIKGYLVRRVYIDQGASLEVMFEHCFENLSPAMKSQLRSTQMDLVGFAGGVVKPLGKIELEVVFGDDGLFRTIVVNFTVVRAPSPYNVIFGRAGLRALQAVSSTIHSMIKFPTPRGIATLVTRTVIIAECRRLEKKQMVEKGASKKNLQEEEGPERVDLTEQTLVNPAYPDQLVTIEGNLSEECKIQLRTLLKKSMDVFAWEPVDMTGGSDQRGGRVGECGNNSACPKDYYPLPNIDGKIESVVGFRYKCFLDAYKGYHQVQMAQEDEEKTAFYTDRDTYCYRKIPFGLKNAGATYQRLVDTAFQSQIGRNLEAYVDDMVIKSNDKKILIADIAETFDNLQRINMKLNPKKCSFGVEEGKFLGYMVTSEGIQANPKKTKAIVDMQSPRTLKEMQSLSWKLAALKSFLSRSAEKSLPFFETLKDITKENKDEYRWTESTEKAFQEMKQCIIGLPLLTTPVKEEMLYVYIAAATEAVSAVLLTERKGNQCPIHYVLRSPPIKVITDQPLKQILNKAQASGKLAKYSMELGAYNIAYEPRSAIKGQVLADFLSEAPGSRAGLVLISPSGLEFTYALRLNFTSTNNKAEYEALLAGLRMAKKMQVCDIDEKVDSKLVASQINGSYVASSTSMIKYLATTKECIAGFRSFVIQNIPRNLNQKTDILSKLATHAFDHLTKKVLVEVLVERSTDQKEVSAIVEEDNWMIPIIRCLSEGV
ncbi:reverse transcriptase domain-containing protein [Tanacetum coccineum]